MAPGEARVPADTAAGSDSASAPGSRAAGPLPCAAIRMVYEGEATVLYWWDGSRFRKKTR